MADIDTDAVADAAGVIDAVAAVSSKGRLRIEVFAAAVAFLIPVASPGGLIAAESWSGRAIILLAVSAVGLPLLWSQARQRRNHPARAAIAFILVGLASAVASSNHTTAIFGLYNQGTGLLFMAGLAGAWAIGRSIHIEARPLVELALLGGVLVNVAIALLASAFDLSSLSASLFDGSGRSSALAGNPVHLGALAVLGLALLVPRVASSPARWAVPVIAIAAAAQLSGTRLTLAVMTIVLLWAGRRYGVRVGALLAMLVVLGLAAGSAIGPGSVSATTRATDAQAADSWSVRPATWLSARHAVAARPILGIGPGQFRTATSRYRSNAIARLEGTERIFTDAHNLFVEYATTTGLLGLAALLLWLMTGSQRAEGCLFAGALAVLAIHMFEPQSVVTTPLLFLALGASASHGVEHVRTTRESRTWILPTCCLAIAIAMASVFFLGEFQLRQAQLDLRLAPARQANTLLPRWPATATIVGRVWLLNGILARSDADLGEARAWRLVAVRRDDSDPALWNDLAELDQSIGRNADAADEFLSALRYDPTSARAMSGLAHLARAKCDTAQANYWTQRSLPLLAPSTAGAVRASPPPPSSCAGK